MKSIPKNRKIREIQKHISFFTHDTPSKIHIMNIDFIVDVVKFGLKFSGLDKIAYKNAKKIKVRNLQFTFNELPEKFNGYKILFISDLHIDGMNPLCDLLIKAITPLTYDICIWGGDYRFLTRGNVEETVCRLKKLAKFLRTKSEIFAILGNHDEFEIAEAIDSFGVKMLINENKKIQREDEAIYLCGLDDCHYYAAHDFNEAEENIPQNEFKILISHSPELYASAEKRDYKLYLAGHTHAGQLCLPGGIPIICEAHVPRRMIFDKWNYKSLSGYTSSGAGTSGTPGRFNSSSEVVIIELQKERTKDES